MATISIHAYGIGLERFYNEHEEPLFWEPKLMQIIGIREDEVSLDETTWRDLLFEYTLDDMIAAAIIRHGDEYPAIKYIESFDAIDDEYIVYRLKPQWRMTEEERAFTEEDIKDAIYWVLQPAVRWYRDFIHEEIRELTIIDEI